MCGIAGGFLLRPGDAARETLLRERVKRMRAALAHRGPDAEGWSEGTGFALGFRRLAILDLSPAGNQPFVVGSIHSVLNGELYDYPSLREELATRGVRFVSSGDAEVVPHLYAEGGADALLRLDGMFALALVDESAERLVLMRDRFGKKPLYYRVVSGAVEFASEAKALIAAGDEPVKPDPAALLRYLTFGYVPNGDSAFSGLRRLGPGERLIAERQTGALHVERLHVEHRHVDRFHVERWYRAPDPMERVVGLEDAVAELEVRLENAVEERLQSDVPLGIFLSGGIDSGLIAAAATKVAKRIGARPPMAFTIGFDDPRFDERTLARATASHLGIDRFVEHVVAPRADEALTRIMATFDEPFADSSAYPTLLVCELARRDVTVALSGDGGDEGFAGYKRHRAVRDAARAERFLPAAARRALAAVFGEPGNGVAGRAVFGQFRRFCAALGLEPAQRNAYWSTFFRAPLRARYFHPEYLAHAACDPDAEAANQFDRASGSALRRALRVDLERYLPDDLLVKTDLASMAHSLEVRCPWLDREVIEFSLSLDDALLQDGSTTKRVPRELAARRLPPAVARAPKRGFGVPLAAWYRGPLASVVRDRLLSPRFRARKILKDDAAKELIERHASGREDWSSYLHALVVLEEWFRRHVDRER